MHPILLALKPIAQTLIMRKVTKEIQREFKTLGNDDSETVELTSAIETAVVSKKKVSAWVGVITALAYYASSLGYIDPALATLINSILSNPETVEVIESIAN